MLDDLTPKELVILVKLLNAVPEGLCAVNDNDELTLVQNLPEARSLAEKIGQAGERDDVKALLGVE